MEDFKKYYEFPLCHDGIAYIWTKKGGMALMFEDKKEFEREDFQKAISEVVNGNLDRRAIPYLTEHTFKYKENATIVDEKDEVFLIVRGWGHLTGCGGLNLPVDKASAIQDEFGQYVVDKLNGK